MAQLKGSKHVNGGGEVSKVSTVECVGHELLRCDMIPLLLSLRDGLKRDGEVDVKRRVFGRGKQDDASSPSSAD